MKLSVVILNWNGADMLRRFLPSVVAYSNEPDVEIIVADNASSDASVDIVRNEFPSVGLICLSKNYGFAGGYNEALKQVNSEYYILLNSDVEVGPGWLRPLVSFMDVSSCVAACQPKILSYRDKESFEYAGAAGGFIDWLGYPFCRGRIFDNVELDKGQYDDAIHVFWATGAALMIRSKDYWGVGGLDERFFAHMEEIDLCWRLRSRGKDIVCVPRSKVYHVGGATLKKENPKKTFLNFRNNLLMLYKNLPERHFHILMFVRKCLDGVAALVFCLKGDWKNAKAVYDAHRAYHVLCGQFKESRKENLQKSMENDIPERVKGSILVSYYLLRKKCFSDLVRGK